VVLVNMSYATPVLSGKVYTLKQCTDEVNVKSMRKTEDANRTIDCCVNTIRDLIKLFTQFVESTSIKIKIKVYSQRHRRESLANIAIAPLWRNTFW